jgi:Flp pilus assembly pilin Flp
MTKIVYSGDYGLFFVAVTPCLVHDGNVRRLGRSSMRALLVLTRLWRDEQGQDMIEYALLAATLAIVVAGFLPPAIMPSVSTIFSRVTSLFTAS